MPEEIKSILDVTGVMNVSVAVAVRKDDKILLIREDEVERKGLLGFPSGKATLDELIFAATEREFLEETGYHVKLTNLVSVYYYKTKGIKHGGNISGQDRLTIRFNFLGELQDLPQEKVVAHEVQDFTWVTVEELQKLVDNKQLRNWLNTKLGQEVLANQSYPLDILYQK